MWFFLAFLLLKCCYNILVVDSGMVCWWMTYGNSISE